MATRGSKQELSARHEHFVATLYNGKRSASSGGAVTDEGDVRVAVDGTLFECKGKFGELAGQKAVRATLLSQFEKVTDEAYGIGFIPAMALRFHAPESILADTDGWVDLVVRLLDDDVARAIELIELREYKYGSCGEEGRCH